MLTVSEAERDLLDAVAAGAIGYLVKSTPSEELRRALARAAVGEPVFSPSLAALVLGEFRRMSKTATGANPLSEREREVLQLVARGHTYRQVGSELYISEKTVENHVRNILGKLHLSRKHELIRYAAEHGQLGCVGKLLPPHGDEQRRGGEEEEGASGGDPRRRGAPRIGTRVRDHVPKRRSCCRRCLPGAPPTPEWGCPQTRCRR